jgi:ABC-type bacteriocin/lantibiotic exporter with double-glycine peptidase domain
MILGVPSGTQLYEYDCGAKCLHLVMQYHNVDIPYPDILSRIESDREWGISVNKMKRLARLYGFKARSAVNFSLGTVEESINRKQPVIVLIQAWAHKNMTLNDWKNVGKGNRDYGHYAVVMGFDDGSVILRDPNISKQIWMTREEFLARWHGGNDRHCAIMIEKQ